MFLYFFLIIIGFFFCLISDKRGKNLGFIFLILLTFFSMFRGINVGIDTFHYYNNDFSNTYEINLSSEVSYDYELLTLLVSTAIAKLGLNPRTFLWFLSIITSVFIFKAAKKFKVSYILPLFFFLLLNYYSISLNQSRQIASASIILYAFSFLERDDKKKYQYFVYVVLATSIHLSSIIFLPVYFVKYLHFESKRVYSQMIFVFTFILFAYVQLHKESFLNTVLGNVDQMSVYEHLGGDTEDRSFSVMGFISALIGLFINVLICLKLLRSDNNKVFPYLLLLTIMLEVLLSAYSGNIGRVLYGFSFIKFIAFASYFGNLRLKKFGEKECLFIFLVVYYSYIMLNSLSAGSYGVVPYYMTFDL